MADTARFCANCGAARDQAPISTPMRAEAPPPTRVASSSARTIGIVASAGLVMAVCVALAHNDSDDKPNTVATTNVAPNSQEPELAVDPPSPAEQLARRLDAAPTLQAAFDITAPSMDDTKDEISPGTAVLALWAAKHLDLDQVRVARDETSVKRVLKDPASERGKRLCVTGRVGQIGKDNASSAPLWTGQMQTTNWDVVRFYAAQSTDDIVEGTRTRFCGMVTGRYSFANAGGGTTHTAELVGVFDIPENRPAEVDVAAPPPSVAQVVPLAPRKPRALKCADASQEVLFEYNPEEMRRQGLKLCLKKAAAPAATAERPAAPDRPATPAEAGEQPIDPFAGDPE